MNFINEVTDAERNAIEEELWDKSFEKTSDKLEEIARNVRREIAEGKTEPMDLEKL